MREQSHKDEMATALRGDFERLRARGVATTLSLQEPCLAAEDGSVGEAAAVAAPPALVRAVSVPAVPVVPAPVVPVPPAPAGPTAASHDASVLAAGEQTVASRSRWLARLRGR